MSVKQLLRLAIKLKKEYNLNGYVIPKIMLMRIIKRYETSEVKVSLK